MPELLFKTITQQSFTVEVEETATIGDVKRRVEETKGSDFPAENQKLIYNGRVLDDASLISELNIEPPKFIVIMVLRKPAPKPSTVGPATSASLPQNTAAEVAATPKVETPAVDAANPLVPPEHAQTVANIEAMGYPRQEVIRALQAAFFDADRAVEYLCNGIPEGLTVQEPTAADGGEAIGPLAEDEDATIGPLNDAEGLAFLAQSPQFQHLREMVRANPSMLSTILTQIAASNPQLMEVITSNQAEFLNLLNSGDGDVDAAAAGGGGMAAATGGGHQDAAPRRIAIPATAQDREAINRLISMGFPEPLAVEAYFACDKNEELAVNYILARMDEFQNEQAGAEQQEGQ